MYRSQAALPDVEHMDVEREAVNTPAMKTAGMQPVQPLGCPFHGSKSALSGKNNIAERRAVLPAQDQDLPGRVVSQRLSNRESPSREAAMPEPLTILINTCSMTGCIELHKKALALARHLRRGASHHF